MSENPEKGQKNESGKIKKAFESNMRKLAGLLSGESMFKTPKATPDNLKDALDVLVKEEKEQMIADIVKEARAMIKEKREFDKFVNTQQKELNKKVETKQKEFNEKAKVLFGMIGDVGALEKSYYLTMKNTSEMKPNTPEVAEEEDDKDDE